MKPVLHLVPRLYPAIDGIGDYALNLARNLRDSCGIPGAFLIGDPSWDGPASFDGFDLAKVKGRSSNDLRSQLSGLDPESLILHYVTYGFHRRGVPFWVNHAIRRWKGEKAGRTLVVVFHELWSSGPPWRSEFYFGWIQKRLVRELQLLADGSLTSTPLMLRQLNGIVSGKTAFAPIPSCTPTPVELDGLQPGTGVVAAIFGQEASRFHSAKAHLPLLSGLFRAGLLDEVRCIGKGARGGEDPSTDLKIILDSLPGAKITVHPDVAPGRLGELLSGSDLALSYYPSAYVCKSSALTAAMACGCLPVLPEVDNAEPLTPGHDVVGCSGTAEAVEAIVGLVRSGAFAEMGRNARSWYDANASWDVTTRAVSKMLKVSHG